ncbi:MAG: CDGSH iron-sulfur domain-containing protein [Gammaproteobacteria bacterium]|nr:CDGSH iron-sulfur domain-containing protein [Gammaproteobacteria bacterium]
MSEPVIAKKGPYIVELEAGKTYYWCSCGRSASQPFCDGSHKGTEFSPQAFSVEESRKAGLCGCKHSANPPFCDGTHKGLAD